MGGATSAANNASALSTQYNQQQQQQYQNLFGGDGKSGAVGSMLDPSKLNVTSPTGVYGLQNTNANTAAAKQYALNAGAVKSNAAQSGFGPGTPAGFVQSQLNSNANALADTKGQNFSTATTNQYQDALNNFWKAAGMSQAQGTAAQGGALGGNQQAGSVYSNLYGTAGHGDVTQNSNLLGNALAAGGQVGAAALCVARGTLIRLADGNWKAVEQIKTDDELLGINATGNRVVASRCSSPAEDCVKLITERGQALTCSLTHTLLAPGGGYIKAQDAIGAKVLTMDGPAKIEAWQRVGPMEVYSLELAGTHVYLSDGIWSEE